MNAIFKYIRKNWFELLVTLFVLSNLFPTFTSNYIYAGAWLLIGYKMAKNKVYLNRDASWFLFLMVFICITSMINLVVSSKIMMFFVILILTCPIYTSLSWHIYKKNLMRFLSYGFVAVTLINLYAYIIGFNLRAIHKQWEDLTDKQFSGFCDQPMWLSAAAAVSSIFCAYNIFSQQKKTKKQLLLYIILLIISIYITMIAGSRSAFIASMAAILILLYILVKSKAKLIKYIVIIGLAVLALSPWMLDRETIGAMMAKQEHQEAIGQTSRDELWAQRMAEYKSSPLIGVGFAAHGVGDETEVGKVEYGGGWISILSQMGILGAIIVLFINLRVLTSLKRIRRDEFMAYIYALYFFFCAHSIVEGYMFQSGWYICLVFWLVTGLLIENKQYGKLIQVGK